MPVTIHYNGKLVDRARLADLLDAARLYCAEQRWMYRDIEESIVGTVERLNTAHAGGEASEFVRAPIDDTLEGILITPNSKTEPLWFTFNKAGYLISYLPLNEPDEYWERASLSVDTQAAGLGTHMALCEFFHTLRDEYMPGLNVYDETNYFESGDVLRAEQAIENSAADESGSALELSNGDDPTELAPQTAQTDAEPSGVRRKKKASAKSSQD